MAPLLKAGERRAFVVFINIAGYVLAVSPMFVTYAPVAPDSLACAACGLPDVQQALTATAQHWISGFVGQVRSSSPWLALVGVLNIAVCGWLLFRGAKPNNSFKPNLLRKSA